MSRPEKDKLKKLSDEIKPEYVKNAISRCYNMLDYISDSAADIITDIVYNSPCQNAKQFLLQKPEDLAVKAFKKVLEDYENDQYGSNIVH
ncbi:MAG: hypothetical protein JW864_00090 [Spirochaetes bacterium]|nr:hypothetical protein [Spirochaetota bacterium]